MSTGDTLHVDDPLTGIRIRTGRFSTILVRAERRIQIEQPAEKRFMPHRPDGPNTIAVRFELHPRNTAYDVRIRVVDKDGALVSEATQSFTDTGSGLEWTWNGRARTAGYVDVRKSPFKISMRAVAGGTPAVGYLIDGERATETGEEAGPVEVVGLPLFDRAWVVSRERADQPLTNANKIIPHDARPLICGVARAIVGGVRAAERGTTNREYFILAGPPPAETARIEGTNEPGQVAVKPWNELLWGPVRVAWQKVQPLSLHSPVYRPHQNSNHPPGRATSHGEYTNVVSNDRPGQTAREATWIGLDVLEYRHDAAGEGPTPAEDNEPGTVRYRFDVDYADARFAFGEQGRIGSYGRRKAEPATTATQARSGLETADFDARLSGISDRVHRISRRGPSTATMLSYAEIYRRVPWIYGSLDRQVESFIGYDCADLATGTARKAGLTRISYTNANNLCKIHTKKRGAGRLYYLDGDTVRRVDNDEAVTLTIGGSNPDDPQLGDIVFFDWRADGNLDHTTILWSGDTFGRTTRLAYAHHALNTPDGFYIGTLDELINGDRVRRFTIRYF